MVHVDTCERTSVMMLSNFDDKRLLLIRQTDHSELAGYLAMHWGNDSFERLQPWNSMVLAAQEHDKAWSQWELLPTISQTGHPIDYISSRVDGSRVDNVFPAFAQDIDRLIGVDAYAGLIALMHAVGLVNRGYGGLLKNMPDRTQDPGGQAFVDEREARRQRLMEELQANAEYQRFATEQHIWENYHLMEIFDLMAQFFCNRYPLSSAERAKGPQWNLDDVTVPYQYGSEQTPIALKVVEDFRAIVEPYPFDQDPLTLLIPGRLAARDPYASQADFLRDYYGGERVIVSYKLQSAA